MVKRFMVLAILAIALISTPAMAKEGVYLGGNLVFSNIVGSDLNDFYDPSVGVEVRIGYNFGKVALEGNYLFVDQTGTDGFADADFTGLTLNLRVPLSEDPTQVYLLGGVGMYSLEDFSAELEGVGYNLGIGVEHFFNPQVALDVRGVYRFIDYDEMDGFSIPDVNGSAFTLGAGVHFYF